MKTQFLLQFLFFDQTTIRGHVHVTFNIKLEQDQSDGVLIHGQKMCPSVLLNVGQLKTVFFFSFKSA